ncbi:MAG: flavin reductase family protein [Desulfovermiculus sp.]|nr:flavin reductase family protein [Desulfovermiculus sp.]
MAIHQSSCHNQEMPQEWIQSLGGMTYGLYVITAGHGQNIGGMIASWVSQVSYAPPLIMIAVHPNRYTHNLIRDNESFVLHILDREQLDFLSRFKGPDPAGKFSGLEWTPGLTGTPVLVDCPAYLECRVTSTLAPGNHTLFIGEIVQAGRRREVSPLTSLDYSGMYVGQD